MATSSRKSPQKDKSTYEEQLLSGEYNWRLKPDIVTLQILPNLRQFLIRLEQENDIQVGFVSEINEDLLKMCRFRIPIYGFDTHAHYNFVFMIWHVVPNFASVFMGYIGDYKKRTGLDDRIRDECSFINPNLQGDLTEDQYYSCFNDALQEAFRKQNIDINYYSIHRPEGQKCYNKIIERNIRNKIK